MQFLKRYPDSELTKSLTESLNYLQEVEDSTFQDDGKSFVCFNN